MSICDYQFALIILWIWSEFHQFAIFQIYFVTDSSTISATR